MGTPPSPVTYALVAYAGINDDLRVTRHRQGRFLELLGALQGVADSLGHRRLPSENADIARDDLPDADVVTYWVIATGAEVIELARSLPEPLSGLDAPSRFVVIDYADRMGVVEVVEGVEHPEATTPTLDAVGEAFARFAAQFPPSRLAY